MSEFQRLGSLPFVARLSRDDSAIHVFPATGGSKPIAGPFATTEAARIWVVQFLEGKLTPEQLDVWRQVAAQLPAPSDFGVELGLIEACARGWPFAQLEKYIPRPERRRVVDRRMIAAGEPQEAT